MDQPPPNLFAEALQILDGYYRALVTKIAEEIVENRDNFDVSYTGKAEEFIDRHGMHLQCLARIYGDLTTVGGPLPNATAELPEMPVQPSGQAVGTETPLEVGAPVLVDWAGVWWRAEVVSLEADGSVRIHYVGWDALWDETVPRSRLQEDTPDPNHNS